MIMIMIKITVTKNLFHQCLITLEWDHHNNSDNSFKESLSSVFDDNLDDSTEKSGG